MHPTTRALLEACSAVLDKGSTAEGALSVATSEWYAAGRPDLKPLVGGDPPVPGIGWGAHPRGSAWIYRVARVSSDYVECWVALDDYPEVIRLDRIVALYLPGAPAPCWVLK